MVNAPPFFRGQAPPIFRVEGARNGKLNAPPVFRGEAPHFLAWGSQW